MTSTPHTRPESNDFHNPETYFEMIEATGNRCYDPAVKYSLGDTLLMKAIRAGYINIIRDLLEIGRCINITNDFGETPAMLAIKVLPDRDISTIKLIISLSDTVNLPDIDGTTALMYAVNRGNAAIISSLVDSGANPNDVDSNGRTPLLIAIHFGNVDMVNVLLGQGASPDRIPNSLSSPLFASISYNNFEALRALVIAGLDVSVCDDGYSPSDYAKLVNTKMHGYILALEDSYRVV